MGQNNIKTKKEIKKESKSMINNNKMNYYLCIKNN